MEMESSPSLGWRFFESIKLNDLYGLWSLHNGWKGDFDFDIFVMPRQSTPNWFILAARWKLANFREFFPEKRPETATQERKFSVHNITYILEAFQYIPTLQEIYGFVEQVFLPLSLFFTLPPPSLASSTSLCSKTLQKITKIFISSLLPSSSSYLFQKTRQINGWKTAKLTSVYYTMSTCCSPPLAASSAESWC